MITKALTVLLAASLSLCAADAAKAPANDKAAKEQKAPAAAVAKPASDKAAAPAASATQININTATVDELQKLHGIGAAKAKAIVDYRKANGNFKNASDLTKVPGIGEKVFAGIKNDVTAR